MDGSGGVPLFLCLGFCLFDLRGCDFSVVIEEVGHDFQEGNGGEVGDELAVGVEEVGRGDAGDDFSDSIFDLGLCPEGLDFVNMFVLRGFGCGVRRASRDSGDRAREGLAVEVVVDVCEVDGVGQKQSGVAVLASTKNCQDRG